MEFDALDPDEVEKLNSMVPDDALVPTPEDELPLTPETLQAKLAAYQKAIKEEFEEAQKASTVEGDPGQEAEKILVNCKPSAAKTMALLAGSSASDMVRMQSAKYILDYGKNAKPEDPIGQLFKELAKNDPTTPPVRP